MTMVRLLISDGSWLVFLTAEKATLALPERTEIPSAVPVGSDVGFESHTTRHFPSSTMGSVSFCALARQPNASAHSTNGSITVTSACSQAPQHFSQPLLLQHAHQVSVVSSLFPPRTESEALSRCGCPNKVGFSDLFILL